MAMDDLLKYVTKATIETEYLPTIEIENPFQPGQPNPVLQRLRPRITLEIAHGNAKPIVMSPYGDPGPTKWPMVQLGLAAAGGVAIFLLLRKLLG